MPAPRDGTVETRVTPNDPDCTEARIEHVLGQEASLDHWLAAIQDARRFAEPDRCFIAFEDTETWDPYVSVAYVRAATPEETAHWLSEKAQQPADSGAAIRAREVAQLRHLLDKYPEEAP